MQLCHQVLGGLGIHVNGHTFLTASGTAIPARSRTAVRSIRSSARLSGHPVGRGKNLSDAIAGHRRRICSGDEGQNSGTDQACGCLRNTLRARPGEHTCPKRKFWCCAIFRPAGAATYQPRAAPWEKCSSNETQALKGRHNGRTDRRLNRISRKPRTSWRRDVSPLQGSGLWCGNHRTQGVALG